MLFVKNGGIFGPPPKILLPTTTPPFPFKRNIKGGLFRPFWDPFCQNDHQDTPFPLVRRGPFLTKLPRNRVHQKISDPTNPKVSRFNRSRTYSTPSLTYSTPSQTYSTPSRWPRTPRRPRKPPKIPPQGGPPREPPKMAKNRGYPPPLYINP